MKNPNARLSLIVPVLNESAAIVTQLKSLQTYRSRGHELIVVDGGSEDETVALVAGLCDRLLVSPPGRARQMNGGASEASGEVLLFLHADTRLPEAADSLIFEGLAGSGAAWGWFDSRLAGTGIAYRVIGSLMSLRARLTRVATGDQAQFLRRELFESVGGFPNIPLMEDIALSKLLRRRSRPVVIRSPVLTSSRRWERDGLINTVLLMWKLRLQYFLGVSPEVLHARYYPGQQQ